MKEFMLAFRHATDAAPTEEQMAKLVTVWQNWMGGIAAQGKFVPGGKRLVRTGKVLHKNGAVTDGPYVEIKEQLSGFIVVKAADIDEAITLAHGCPIFELGGSVEVRPIAEQA